MGEIDSARRYWRCVGKKSNTAILWVHRIRTDLASHADFFSGTGNSMTFPR